MTLGDFGVPTSVAAAAGPGWAELPLLTALQAPFPPEPMALLLRVDPPSGPDL